jgi:hypothetical protein
MHQAGRIHNRVAPAIAQPRVRQPVKFTISGRKQRIARRCVAGL